MTWEELLERRKFIEEMRKKRMTVQEIGELLGITRQRVSQILRQKYIRGTRKRKPHLIGMTGLNYIREEIRRRDNYTCQICLRKWELGKRRFDVHHEDERFEGRSNKNGAYKIDKENWRKMITLCHKCHMNLDSVRAKMLKGRG
jgi:predicted transcriptional regulator